MTKKVAAVAIFGLLSPFVATLGINGIGFTAAGIVKGTIAALMMSAEAIANGGGVAAKGLVAILQSIGAAGLSYSGMLVVGLLSAFAMLGTLEGYESFRKLLRN